MGYNSGMELRMERKWVTENSVISELSVDGKHECFILQGTHTLIPNGRYQVVITVSPRFSVLEGRPVSLPLLLAVPGFEGVRIHSGNTAADTTACLLPGTTAAKDKVLQSQLAFNSLYPKIQAALDNNEEVWITL